MADSHQDIQICLRPLLYCGRLSRSTVLSIPKISDHFNVFVSNECFVNAVLKVEFYFFIVILFKLSLHEAFYCKKSNIRFLYFPTEQNIILEIYLQINSLNI